MSRYQVPVYTLTIFLSAFLLFVFQPMVGKFLLPLLGGTPSVWNTAMLFFQLLLLAGYIYAHILSHIQNPRAQAMLHIALMAIAAFALPLALPATLEPIGLHPVWWQLKTMIGMAAGPFFILSASAPLLQKWFSRTKHPDAQNPYFLYSASNIGSMLALLSYPIVTEPLFGLHQQSLMWAIGYGALACLFIFCAATSKFEPEVKVETSASEDNITWKRRFTWVFLAFCPSSLMLGYTTYITTDIASVPLFWVIPLALYLGTFIIAFSNKPYFSLPVTRILQGILLVFLLFVMVSHINNGQWTWLVMHGLLFFFTALMCHQEAVALKPKVSKLTEFYLFISLGGALGGVFNSLIAPVIFKLPYEYFLVILLSVFARYASLPLAADKEFAKAGKNDWKAYALFPGVMIIGATAALTDTNWVMLALAFIVFALSFGLLDKRVAFLTTFIVIGIFNPPYSYSKLRDSILIERNFFGVLRIQDYTASGERVLSNGTTTHGSQALSKNFKRTPLTYYYPLGSAGDIFGILDDIKTKTPQKVAALGLGVGSISCYKHAGRSFDFYEINPAVIDITQNPKYFSYLHDCGSPYKIVMGDARQEIAKAPDHSYDLIFVDVFSSDNIPMHILTVEAMQIYKQKLKPGGIIVVHVSNRFFTLKNEVAAIGHTLGLTTLSKMSVGGKVMGTDIQYYPSIYTVLTDNTRLTDKFEAKGWLELKTPEKMHPWTDDYANIVRAFNIWKSLWK